MQMITKLHDDVGIRKPLTSIGFDKFHTKRGPNVCEQNCIPSTVSSMNFKSTTSLNFLFCEIRSFNQHKIGLDKLCITGCQFRHGNQIWTILKFKTYTEKKAFEGNLVSWDLTKMTVKYFWNFRIMLHHCVFFVVFFF